MPAVAERLAGRLMRPVSATDRARAALHVLDWTGCAVAGARSEPARAMAVAAAGDECLYWGALGNVLEMDDVDKRALLHPGPVVVPAALAAADENNASATEFLDAVVRGYEAMIRVGRAVGPAHYRFWHNTATCGPFGAAAATASLLDLGAGGYVDALGLAGTQASGLWQTRHEPGSHAKQLHTARAAHAGLLAGKLAAAGFVGVRTIFEGPQGFFAATCGDADPAAVADFPESDGWRLSEVSFKPWPACRHAHAAIDAALAIGLAPDDIERVTVRAYRDAIVFCDKPEPRDTLSAKFSLQHAVAVALLHGAPALAHFEGAGLDDRAVAALRRRIDVAEDAALTARYPARFGAGLDIELRSGAQRSIDIADALGDPENPLDDARIVGKADMLMAHAGLEAPTREALIAAALGLRDGGGVAGIISLLRKATTP